MEVFAHIILWPILIFDLFLLYMHGRLKHTMRRILKGELIEYNGSDKNNLQYLKDKAAAYPELKDYFISQSSTFLLPYGGNGPSQIGSVLMLILIVLIPIFLFLQLFIFALMAFILAFLTGYASSRFNTKSIFEEKTKELKYHFGEGDAFIIKEHIEKIHYDFFNHKY